MFHRGLGQRVRKGSWRDHQSSTYDLAQSAMTEGRFQDAAELAGYTIQEALEPHELYRDWIPEIRSFLSEGGVGEAEIAADEAGLLETLRWDDGTAFDAEIGWDQFCDLIERTRANCACRDSVAASATLEAARQVWLATHDRKCDWVQHLISITALRLGENRIGALWDRLMAPMFTSYKRYDIDVTPWPISFELLLQVTAEALRGHLSGPGRRGTIELVEEADRIGFRFRPCGSGGRNFDDTAGGQPEPAPFPVTEERHDWAWNLKGVCLYCTHCCALSERNPIQLFGYPARVVEPPFRNEIGSRTMCTWWVYKDPALIPDDVYRRTGNAKPARLGGRARRSIAE